MTGLKWELLAAALAAGLVAFVLSAAQSFINAKHGTDHAVHSFLVRAVRSNRYRLFVRVPGLLNEAYVGALPLYLHWIFAHFPERATRWAERLLNPAVNAMHTLFVAGIAALVAAEADLGGSYIVLTALLFALTPQFYHALSARNFGLSARSLGLILLSIFFLAVYLAEAGDSGWWPWLLLILAGYLTWAFSTFGSQALLILALLLAILTGRFVPLAGSAMGLLLFIAVHPRYSLGYLRHTLRFIGAYAAELAPVYVLAHRYSIWRDLVRDIWVRIREDAPKGLRYAYGNSFLIVILLNPLLLLGVAAKLFAWFPAGSLTAFAADVALCGAAAMLLTSFRATRFLGEPERYVEAVTPWAVLAATALLFDTSGATIPLLLVIAYVAASGAQLYASLLLSRYLERKPFKLAAAEQAIASSGMAPIRCCSNNEQLTKLLMHNDWTFSYCISLGSGYCGMAVGEAFSSFPFLKREALQKIVETYRINLCAIDRSQYETIFDAPPTGLAGCRIIHQTELLRVVALDWDDDEARKGSAELR